MPSLRGRFGSRPKSTFPISFSYGPAAPNGRPLSTTSRRSMRRRTTRASASDGTSVRTIVAMSTDRDDFIGDLDSLRDDTVRRLRSHFGIREIPAHLVDEARDLFHLH